MASTTATRIASIEGKVKELLEELKSLKETCGEDKDIVDPLQIVIKVEQGIQGTSPLDDNDSIDMQDDDASEVAGDNSDVIPGTNNKADNETEEDAERAMSGPESEENAVQEDDPEADDLPNKPAVLKCQVCHEYSTSSRANYYKHMYVRHKVRRVRVAQFGKINPTEKVLLECPRCDDKSSLSYTPRDYAKHFASRHPEEKKLRLKCPDCKVVLFTLKAFDTHRSEFHNEERCTYRDCEFVTSMRSEKKLHR